VFLTTFVTSSAFGGLKVQRVGEQWVAIGEPWTPMA
jgi:hypothetical protein